MAGCVLSLFLRRWRSPRPRAAAARSPPIRQVPRQPAGRGVQRRTREGRVLRRPDRAQRPARHQRVQRRKAGHRPVQQEGQDPSRPQKYDSQGDPAQAPQLAQKVIADKTVAVVGPAFSGESKAADPIFEQANIVNVTASATNPTLAANGWKFWHRAVGNDNSQGPAAANYITKKIKAKTVAVIDDNEEYGLGIADIVRTTLKNDGRQRGRQRPHRQERPGLFGDGQQDQAGQRRRHLLRWLLLRGRPLPEAAS